MRASLHAARAPNVMSALRRRVEEPVEDAGMAPGEERAPKIWKTATVAVLLFVTGSLMIFYGVQALGEAGGRERAVSMCAVGAIAFLPGSYATWHLYGAWRRWPGYSYDLVPSYDE